MALFRKKPVVIEAFCLGVDAMPDWFVNARNSGLVRTYAENNEEGPFGSELSHATIETLEGTHRADHGDWVIRGVKGELYPCKPDIFSMTYEEA